MKIIFLDIDGVLTNKSEPNSFLFYCGSENYKLNDYNVRCLDRILKSVDDCKIVLSTSWRNYPDNHIMIDYRNGDVYKSLIPDVKFKFDQYILDSAPHKDGQNKYSDICDYLNSQKNILDFVVIDDDPTQGLEGFGPQFFKTNINFGLNLQISNSIIEYFQNY